MGKKTHSTTPSKKKYHDIAQYLLTQLHLDPNTPDHEGTTPLMIATEKGDINMLQLLTQLGANPHATDHKGQTALHYAACYGHDKAVQYLIIQLHLDPNTQDHQRQYPTPHRLPSWLRLHRQNPHPARRQPTHPQLQRPNPSIHRQPTQNPTPQTKTIHHHPLTHPRTRTPIPTNSLPTPAQHHPCYHDNTHHPSSPMRIIDQQLIEACKNSDAPTIEKLLRRRGANPNAKDENGKPLIIIATECGHLKIITTLIQHGANPYVTDHEGQTALHHTAECSQTEVIAFLITLLHLDPNTQDHHGNTPLHIALQEDHTFATQTLIRLGAHPHIPNHQGKKPSPSPANNEPHHQATTFRHHPLSPTHQEPQKHPYPHIPLQYPRCDHDTTPPITHESHRPTTPQGLRRGRPPHRPSPPPTRRQPQHS